MLGWITWRASHVEEGLQQPIVIEIEGQREFGDYLEVVKLATGKRILFPLLAVVLLGMLLAIWGYVGREWYFFGAGAAALILAPLIVWTSVRWLARRTWASSPARNRSVRYRFAEDGVSHADAAGGFEGRAGWDILTRWQESARVVVLYTGQNPYIYVPKKLLTDQQVADLRSLLEHKIGKR